MRVGYVVTDRIGICTIGGGSVVGAVNGATLYELDEVASDDIADFDEAGFEEQNILA